MTIRKTGLMLLSLKVGERLWAKESRQTLAESWKRQGNKFYPRTSCRCLDFSPARPPLDSDFQNCEILNVCCFMVIFFLQQPWDARAALGIRGKVVLRLRRSAVLQCWVHAPGQTTLPIGADQPAGTRIAHSVAFSWSSPGERCSDPRPLWVGAGSLCFPPGWGWTSTEMAPVSADVRAWGSQLFSFWLWSHNLMPRL